MGLDPRQRILMGMFRGLVIVPLCVVLAWLLLWPTNSGIPALILISGAIMSALWGGSEIAFGVLALRRRKGNLPRARVVK